MAYECIQVTDEYILVNTDTHEGSFLLIFDLFIAFFFVFFFCKPASGARGVLVKVTDTQNFKISLSRCIRVTDKYIIVNTDIHEGSFFAYF